MRSLVVIALLLVACGGRGDDDEVAIQECALAPADLLAPTDANRTCIRNLFYAEPARAAALLNQLDWARWKDTTEKLKALPVEDRWWYLVALDAQLVPRAALAALQIAGERTQDRIFAADIELTALQIALRANDESTANTALDKLMSNTEKIGAQKLALLSILAKRRQQKHIENICRNANEPAIAWRCLELAPDLPEALAACGRLPVLSYRDIAKFEPLRNKLVGLRCTREGARGLRSIFERVEARETARAEEVTLYSRLALDAPPDVAKCLLEEAARGCLSLIRQNQPCPALDSVARYVAVAADEDRMAAFQAVFEGKNREYNVLYNESKDAGANLFHLHVVLAELLVARDELLFRSPTRAYELPYYHVIRARRFWADVKEPRVAFHEMLSPKLQRTFCADADCAQTCRLRWFGEPSDCRGACKAVRQALSCDR